jgi:hypothetical protein
VVEESLGRVPESHGKSGTRRLSVHASRPRPMCHQPDDAQHRLVAPCLHIERASTRAFPLSVSCDDGERVSERTAIAPSKFLSLEPSGSCPFRAVRERGRRSSSATSVATRSRGAIFSAWIVAEWVPHYNRGRPHASLGPGIPRGAHADRGTTGRPPHSAGTSGAAKSMIAGLHHKYRPEPLGA